jgi:hypothetical protein
VSFVDIMAPVAGPSTDELVHEVLQSLDKTDPILSAEVFPDVPFDSLKAALARLASRSMVTYEQIEQEQGILEPEAQQILEHGSHEARVFEVLRKAVGALSIQEIDKEIGDKTVTKVGPGKALKEGWIKKDSGGKFVASVSALTQAVLLAGAWLTAGAGKVDNGHDQRTAARDIREEDHRCEGHGRLSQAETNQDEEGYHIQDWQGAEFCA